MTLTTHTTASAEQLACPDRVTQLLRDAADHIRTNGLWQGAYYSTAAGIDGPTSLVGALHVVAGHQPQPPLTFAYGHGLWPVEPDFETALELTAEVLNQLWPGWAGVNSEWIDAIEAWQDTRNGPDVLAALDAAALLAAARHSGTIR